MIRLYCHTLPKIGFYRIKKLQLLSAGPFFHRNFCEGNYNENPNRPIMEKEKIWSVDELVKESRDSLKNDMEESYEYLKSEIDGDKEQAVEKAYEAFKLAVMNYIEELEATLENGMKIVPAAERKRKFDDICFYLTETIERKSGKARLAGEFDSGWLTIDLLCTNYYGERELMSFEKLERKLSKVYRTIKIVTDELPRDKEWATYLYEKFNPKPQNFIMESEQSLREEIQQIVRNYPDFPTKGILFRDVLPLFAKPAVVQSLCKFIANRYKGKVDVVAGLEARGFLFGSIVAYELGLPFVPIRKKGKLPGPVITAEYQKEYGTDVFQIQQGVLKAGQRVLLLDDLLATGGSLKAAEQLVKMAQAKVEAIFVVIELSKLDGRKILSAPVIDALISYSD